ncbi:D-alanyl-D-alanine carboxypeptidase family protein [Streptomyces winkii]|uniref:D-alanyl-D-alanine carboxypeptidase family protein n=1 Tax=Streptomyces winkii TaxID=3051178 RepID=UPI0028D74197|nr:D-alanyl-D-alanine carboxypeptidase [Streptomyces sp. DSM 40971]
MRPAHQLRVRGLRIVSLALAAAVIGLCAQHPTSASGAPRPRGCLATTKLPWPDEGQATMAIEGIGNLGLHGGRTPVPIASVTKVMTAYVILRNHPLTGDDPGPGITVDARAEEEALSRDESSVPVRRGQRFGERELLQLMLIPSGNNIARMLARWDAGSERAFVAKMNEAARDLGMNGTTYTGASGFEPTTVSTAADQLKLAQAAMRDSVFRSIVGMPSARVSGVPHRVVNTNSLLGESGVIGGKTGSSTVAGGALMWAAEREFAGERRLVLGVVLRQAAATSSEEGLRTALANSRRLMDGIPSTITRTCPDGRSADEEARASKESKADTRRRTLQRPDR